MAKVIKHQCSLVMLLAAVAVGLIALVQLTGAAPAPQQEKSAQSDLTPSASGTSGRLFDLSSWTNRYPYYNYNRPYYPGGGYYPTRPYYPNQGGYYPNQGYPNQGYYPNYNTGGYPSSGYYPNTGFGTGNGGYGGFGGNGGLTTYYGYGRDDYYGDRNIGYGYQQGTNSIGLNRGDQTYNNYNSYSSSSSPMSSGYSYY